jgi:REP element-mobilizing transposase RayT
MKIIEKEHKFSKRSCSGQTTVLFTVCFDRRNDHAVDDAFIRMAIDILTMAVKKNHCIVPCYCFMPDHLQAIVMGINERANVWGAVIEFKQRTGYWMSQNMPHISWQEGFFDQVIRPHEDLGAQVRYILSDSVRQHLVETWQDYPYSGAIECDLKDVLYIIS